MKRVMISAAALIALACAGEASATDKGKVGGAITGAVGGAVVAGPVGAVVGGVGGAIVGNHYTNKAARKRAGRARHHRHHAAT